MACGEWAVPHKCPICGIKRSTKDNADPLDYFEASLEHVSAASKCYGGVFDENSSGVSGSWLVLELLQVDDEGNHPEGCIACSNHLAHSRRFLAVANRHPGPCWEL